jgi:hypothetical protein
MKHTNNEDHSVDKLFARKLGNLEGTPSANAWQTLQKGLSQKARKKNRVALWLPYASAAAIALLIVSVWLLRQQLPGGGTTTIADNTQTETKKDQEGQPSIQTIPQIKDTEASLSDHSTREGQLAVGEKPAKKEGEPKQHKQAEKAYERLPKGQIIDKSPAVKVVPEKPIQEKLTKPTVTRLESTVAGLEKQTAVLTPSSLTQTENTTLVVTVQLEEETDIAEVVEEIPEEEQTEQVEKQSKAGKFFSTLKKIKKGDFNELGIKPEAIVAYVKDKASSNNQPNEK